MHDDNKIDDNKVTYRNEPSKQPILQDNNENKTIAGMEGCETEMDPNGRRNGEDDKMTYAGIQGINAQTEKERVDPKSENGRAYLQDVNLDMNLQDEKDRIVIQSENEAMDVQGVKEGMNIHNESEVMDTRNENEALNTKTYNENSDIQNENQNKDFKSENGNTDSKNENRIEETKRGNEGIKNHAIRIAEGFEKNKEQQNDFDRTSNQNKILSNSELVKEDDEELSDTQNTSITSQLPTFENSSDALINVIDISDNTRTDLGKEYNSKKQNANQTYTVQKDYDQSIHPNLKWEVCQTNNAGKSFLSSDKENQINFNKFVAGTDNMDEEKSVERSDVTCREYLSGEDELRDRWNKNRHAANSGQLYGNEETDMSYLHNYNEVEFAKKKDCKITRQNKTMDLHRENQKHFIHDQTKNYSLDEYEGDSKNMLSAGIYNEKSGRYEENQNQYIQNQTKNYNLDKYEGDSKSMLDGTIYNEKSGSYEQNQHYNLREQNYKVHERDYYMHQINGTTDEQTHGRGQYNNIAESVYSENQRQKTNAKRQSEAEHDSFAQIKRGYQYDNYYNHEREVYLVKQTGTDSISRNHDVGRYETNHYSHQNKDLYNYDRTNPAIGQDNVYMGYDTGQNYDNYGLVHNRSTSYSQLDNSRGVEYGGALSKSYNNVSRKTKNYNLAHSEFNFDRPTEQTYGLNKFDEAYAILRDNQLIDDTTGQLTKRRKTKKEPFEKDVKRIYVKGSRKRPERLSFEQNESKKKEATYDFQALDIKGVKFVNEYDKYNYESQNAKVMEEKPCQNSNIENHGDHPAQNDTGYKTHYNDYGAQNEMGYNHQMINQPGSYIGQEYNNLSHEFDTSLHNPSFNAQIDCENAFLPSEYIYNCDPCMKKFKRLSTLKIHIFSHIRDAKIFNCPKTHCGSGFKSQAIAIKHIQHFHRDERNMLTDLLKRSKYTTIFRSYTALIDYHRICKLPNPFIDNFCFGCFTYPRSMVDHPCSRMFYNLHQCPSCKVDIEGGKLSEHVYSDECMRPGIVVKEM